MGAVDISALKSALGARTELELAAKLGIARSTVSQWRRRGSIPARYHGLLAGSANDSEAAAAGQQVFQRSEARYWLRTALALLPRGDFRGESVLQAGRSREQLVAALMGLAIRVARTDLKLKLLRDDADWTRLMECLLSGNRDAVIAVLRSHGETPSADVLNGVLNRGD